VPTIRFEREGQQVGCIEGANLRKAALDAGVNPYKGLNNINNCGGIGQCGGFPGLKHVLCIAINTLFAQCCPKASAQAIWPVQFEANEVIN
jgi:hypothetical protein